MPITQRLGELSLNARRGLKWMDDWSMGDGSYGSPVKVLWEALFRRDRRNLHAQSTDRIANITPMLSEEMIAPLRKLAGLYMNVTR